MYFDESLPLPNEDRLIDKPLLIKNIDNFNDFLQKMKDQDLIECVTGQRLDTSWTLHTLTNISFYVYPIPSHAIGCGIAALPEYIRNNRALVSLNKDNSRKLYTDNLCFLKH